MKIMKSVDKKIGDKIYYKYKINLPKKIVEENNLLNKDLNIIFDVDKIIIKSEKIKNNLTDKQKKIQRELLRLIKEH